MDDIEKLFKEKLAQHPVAPPPGVWEKLQQAQVQEKKKGAWWWMAASVAILLLVGVAFMFTQQPTATNDTVAVELPKVQPQALESITEQMSKPVLEHPIKTAEPTPVAKIRSIPGVASQVTASENLESETIKLPVTIAKVETTSPQKPQSELKQLPQTTLIADALVQPKTTVTIIYKSGNTDDEIVEEPKKPLKKAFAFLSDIKDGGVGFSELRSAKSEIISKAFSSKREPMATE